MKWLFLLKMYFVWCMCSLSDIRVIELLGMMYMSWTDLYFFSHCSWCCHVVSQHCQWCQQCQVSHQPRLEERWNSAEHQIGAEARHHWLPRVRLPGTTDRSDRSGGGVQVRRSSRTGDELFGEFFGVKDNSLQKGAGYNKMNSYISLSLLL